MKRTNAKNDLPKGWTEAKVQRVLKHYEQQGDIEAAAEDEAAYRNRKQTHMIVPVKLVPAVRKLITRRAN
jgi:hypothetical protein